MAEDERQIRVAIENLLSGSINSQRSSYTQHSIALTPEIMPREDLIAGTMQNGRMSNVRRFYCLIVTFDLLLTCLMWLICTMIAGENLSTAFVEQVVHYHIKTSLFDIVMVAICRFTVLLLFYGLLHVNHWIIIALSTAATSAFLLAKVFLFDWTICNQPVFLVLLILSSFVLAWVEAWFLDFRVIPQETDAGQWFRSLPDFTEPERAPLLREGVLNPRVYQSAEPSGNFFTPVDSPDHSDNEDNWTPGGAKRLSKGSEAFLTQPLPRLASHEIEEYKGKVSILRQKCHELLASKEWQVECQTPNGDVVLYMDHPQVDGRIIRIEGVIDAPAGSLVNRLFDDIETSPSWNKLVTESSRLQKIDENTDIVYQATSPQAGGMIKARDFVILRHRSKCGTYYVSGGTSVTLSSLPVRKHVIRGENGVSCWAAEEIPDQQNKCRFTWILNTNLKGWLSQSLVQKSLSTALVDFMSYLRKHVESENTIAA